MRSRAPKFNIMDPIQKMEILDPYAYMLHGYNNSTSLTSTTENGINITGNKVKHEPKEAPDASPTPSAVHSDSQFKADSPGGEAAALVTPVLSAGPPKRRKTSHDSSIEAFTDDEKTPNDDYHFLMSLHPYMTDLSPSQKLRVRMKIQKLIFKELYGTDGDDIL